MTKSSDPEAEFRRAVHTVDQLKQGVPLTLKNARNDCRKAAEAHTATMLVHPPPEEQLVRIVAVALQRIHLHEQSEAQLKRTVQQQAQQLSYLQQQLQRLREKPAGE